MTPLDEWLFPELDLWDDAGTVASIWWRDDDAISDTPQLRRLLGTARNAGIQLALGAVPEFADQSLATLLSQAECCVWQHGWGHHFFEAGEFGEGRSLDLLRQDALAGQRALDRLFGPSGWQRVFVPPNHLISMAFKALVPTLGYLGVSAGVVLTPALEDVLEVNAEVDVMNWIDGKVHGPKAVCDMLVEQLRLRRLGAVPVERPIGILTHHLVFDEDAWQLVTRLFEVLSAHAAVVVLRADTLFRTRASWSCTSLSRSSSGAVPKQRAPAEITVVLTSCGRQDLLIRTLDTFFARNTHPIREFIVIEDGNREKNRALEQRYLHYRIRWMSTDRRVGQIAAIDIAYCLVKTEYIFHCEDDWEFIAPGFMEKSLSVLNANAKILQVWIRSVTDTNDCNVMNDVFFAGDVPYRLIQPGHHTDEWGTWHGFSFNPGLRRTCDYQLIGSFGALDPSRARRSYEVEREASEVYFKHGMLAAILADNGGLGYVRHIGWDRRVGDPTFHRGT